MTSLHIRPIAAFDDNYFWLIHDHQFAVIIDPGDAKPVQAVLQQENLTLCAILLTHHHPDHISGVADLLASAAVPVFGAQTDLNTGRISSISQGCQQGASIFLDKLALQFEVLEVPGHTSSHLAYYSPQLASVFCGDTLFAGGCGRLFEGSPAQMLSSLNKLAALPGNTKVYCAHEYTLSNLRFALMVEPENQLLQERYQLALDSRERGLPTVPSLLKLEQQTNPFLRSASPEIIQTLRNRQLIDESSDEVAVFAAVRHWKDQQ